ncbi:YbdD/YjiX family protein [Leucobacter sp. M11]|uniref:YbdD/YjiX family protein n=1 Tax=Leucobacter sp. M11 TaxID=2993565 RepID=UPI002D7E91C6|nr:YbdD/YjiX family protein [Leucobacter sp. M11]MEB4615006.1 YbdD/YjiX family protein [Leucobacter sp. M11]
MGSVLAAVAALPARLWQGLRELSGETRYERFAAHRRRTHPGEPVPSAREFWRMLSEDEERNPGSRCC